MFASIKTMRIFVRSIRHSKTKTKIMKAITKTIEITKDNKTFLVTLRTVFYANLMNPTWGHTFYSAIFKESGNTIGGTAMMKKTQFLSQLDIAVKHLN
jgi:predicted transcriptional regulator